MIFAATLSGCADPMGRVIVPIDSAPALSRSEAGQRVNVSVYDIRKEVRMERMGVGGISMGMITLQPPMTELVRIVIEDKAEGVLANRDGVAPPTVLCGIRIFDITTPATLFYWDVTTRIELVLRVGEQDRTISGAATERTFVWPSEDIIRRTTKSALDQVGNEAERALVELMSTR